MRLALPALLPACSRWTAAAWACLSAVPAITLPPDEVAAKAHAGHMMAAGWGLVLAAALTYRFRIPIGERLARWRARLARPDVGAVVSRPPARLAASMAAGGAVLLVYGLGVLSRFPSDSCGP